MAQMPPPPQPAPAGATPSSVGTNKKTYTILAYVLTWVGGLIFLFVGKDDADVKWNAANSLLVFGSLTILNIILGFIPVVHLFTFPVIMIVWVVLWIYFLVKSLQGNGERIPVPGLGGFLNPYVEQIANAVK
jgi:uncharacterized membrane protein